MRRLAACALVTLTLVAAPLPAQDDDGGGFLETLIEDNLSGAGRDVQIRGFQGALSSVASLDELTIADDQGIWITLRDVTLDWNRAALLRGRLEVRQLTAGEIILPRAPQSDPALPTPEATPFALPELPVSVRIDKVAAARVDLGAALFGAAAVVSLEGSASLDGGAGAANIALQRIDGRVGALTLDAAYDNADENLALKLNVTEAEDGIAANLLDLPGRPSLRLNVDGTGPLSDFIAAIELDTAGERRIDGTVALTASGEGAALTRGFSAEIGGDIAPVFAPQYRPFFGPDIRLIARGMTRPEGGFALSQLRLSAAALTLEGQVTVAAGGLPEVIDVTGQIAAPGGGPVLLPFGGGGTRVGRLGLAVQFDAAVSEDWTAQVTLDDLTRPDIAIDRVELSGIGQITDDGPDARSVTANLDFSATGLAAMDSAVQQALGNSATGRASIAWTSGAPLMLRDLQLSGASFALDGEGQLGFGDAGTRLTLGATVQAQNLTVFSGLAGRDLGGAAEVRLDVQAAPLEGSLDLAVTGVARDLQVDQPQADALLAGRTEVVLRAERDETGTRLSALTLDNPALSLEASGDLTSVASSLRANIRLADAAVLDDQLSGPVSLTGLARSAGQGWDYEAQASGVGAEIDSSGTITGLSGSGSGPQRDPRISTVTTVAVDDLARFSTLAGRPLAGDVDLTLTGDARLDLSELEGDLTLSARSLRTGLAKVDPLLAGVVDLAARVSRAGDTVTVDDLRLGAAALGLRLTGSARGEAITGDNPLLTLDAALSADNLAPLSALAGRPLGGAVDLTLTAQGRPDLTVLDLVLDGQARSITLGQSNLDRLLRGATTLGLSASRGGETLELPRLNIANDQITLSAEGRYLAGESALNADVAIADLADLDVRMRGQAKLALLAKEVGAVWQVTLDGDAADAVLRASGEVRDALSGNPMVAGQASLRAGDLSRFAPLANRPLAGSLRAEVQGNARADLTVFDVTADVSGSNLRVGQTEADRILGASTDLRLAARRAGAGQPIAVQTFRIATPSLTASATGSVLGSDANLAVEARLSDIGPYVAGALSGPVAVDGRVNSTGSQLGVNLSGTGPGGITLRADGTVAQDFSRANLALTGQGPLALANGLIAPRSLDGTLGFDLAVNGPLALSSVSGQMNSTGARLVAPNLNLVLENIALEAALRGNTVQVNLQGDKQQGGRITVTGPIALVGGLDSDLTIAAVGLVVEDPRLYRTLINGNITVNGPLAGGARVSGLLDLVETEVRIPSTGLGATGPIPDGLVHLNEPAAVRATRARAGLIETDGTGADARGTARPYPLDLTIRADNRFFVRGRGLDAEMNGVLTLQGTTQNIIPAGQFKLVRGRLDILGKRLNLVEGSVSLQGDTTPFIRLVASTDVDDVTILIVVEGEALQPGINFLSEPELPEEEVLSRLLFGRALGSISPLQAAQLASAVATLAGRGGDGIIANLRKSTGLDDLDITTDADGNAGLRAGKYLSEKLYTDVTVGATGQAEINLNLDLTPSLTIKGGAGNDGETSLGIFFEQDY